MSRKHLLLMLIVILGGFSGYGFYRFSGDAVFAIFFTFGMMGIAASWLRNQKK
jgi:hypothetical protein